MKKFFTLFILSFFLTGAGIAQQASFITVDAGLLRNHQGFFKLYSGVVDVGMGYHIPVLKDLHGGISLHTGFLNYKNTPARSVLFRPKINLQYAFYLSRRLAVDPTAALGYSFVRITNEEYGYKETQKGINYLGELKIRWKSPGRLDYFLFGRYEYILLDRDETFTEIESFRQIELYSVGFGVKIKPGLHE